MVHYLPHRIWCSPFILIHDGTKIIMAWHNKEDGSGGLQPRGMHDDELWVKTLSHPDARIGIRCKIKYISIRSNKNVDDIYFDNRTVAHKGPIWVIYCPTTDRFLTRSPTKYHRDLAEVTDLYIPSIIIEKAKMYVRKEAIKIVKDRINDVPITWWVDTYIGKKQKLRAAAVAAQPIPVQPTV